MRNYVHSIFILLLSFTLFSCSTESTPIYQLTTGADPVEAGNVTQIAPEAEEGESIEITASANQHWVFIGWQGDLTGAQNPASILMDMDKSVTASFVKRDYPLTINIMGSGEVNEEVVTARATEYQHGNVVQLTAVPSENWEFGGWSGGDDSSEIEIIVEVDGPVTITATFNRKEFTLATETNGAGSIAKELISGTQTDGGYLFESEVELNAVADTGWVFNGWDGDLTGSETPQQLFMDSNKNVTATFEELAFTVTIQTEGSGNATVNPDKEVYRLGDELLFEAVPASGNEFLGWSGSFSEKSRTVTKVLEQDLEVKATFSTVEDALRHSFSGGTFINGRVFGASLSLQNRLPEEIVLRKFALLNANGVELTSAEDNETIPSGNRISYSISFGIAPTKEAFSQYYAAWHVTYKGTNYLKQTRVGTIGTSAKEKSEKEVPSIRTLYIEE